MIVKAAMFRADADDSTVKPFGSASETVATCSVVLAVFDLDITPLLDILGESDAEAVRDASLHEGSALSEMRSVYPTMAGSSTFETTTESTEQQVKPPF